MKLDKMIKILNFIKEKKYLDLNIKIRYVNDKGVTFLGMKDIIWYDEKQMIEGYINVYEMLWFDVGEHVSINVDFNNDDIDIIFHNPNFETKGGIYPQAYKFTI